MSTDQLEGLRRTQTRALGRTSLGLCCLRTGGIVRREQAAIVSTCLLKFRQCPSITHHVELYQRDVGSIVVKPSKMFASTWEDATRRNPGNPTKPAFRVVSLVPSDQRLSSRWMHERIRNDGLPASTPQFSRVADASQCVVVGLRAAIGGYGIAPSPCVVSTFPLPCISSPSRATQIVTWDAPTAIFPGEAPEISLRVPPTVWCCFCCFVRIAAIHTQAGLKQSSCPCRCVSIPRTKHNNAS